MNSTSLAKAGILTVVLVAATVISWELYVRSKGYDASYDDEGPLWSDKRRMASEPIDRATVFIGSSRIKFDLDIKTWESITGDHAVQLACVGSTPIPVLEDLANDPAFKGKLIVDVTEPLFFSTSGDNQWRPRKNLKYYKDETPAQWASFKLNRLLESQFVFLDKDRLSLNAMLDRLQIPDRPGVRSFPIFPVDFGRVKFNRQEYMTERFAADTNLQNQVKGIWDFFRKNSKDPPASGAKLDSLLNLVKTSVDKIKARGGEVFFVRTPSSNPMLMGESMGFPRDKYWERILAVTGCKGLHFADYPEMTKFRCPELSHLTQPDAVAFTKLFIRILTEEKGWKFSKQVQP
ncbi:MAG TPA: hypothetical protein PLT49_12855 [Ferruginibacter sp.]|nr:hypothetical protein [Ferruginibacter sp.]HNA17237.1 hypothetical protein [Ferruginibacter sp.]HNF02551.1 hypothetical protein [Ferruginibacter sp.]HNF44562.1 hypothetical protein [Ferruginibacter sp.]HNJ28125.1 hypothetical protein [Ferruginibacter sp.]